MPHSFRFFRTNTHPRPNQESIDAFQAWSLHPWCACSASSDKISCSWTHGTIICIMMTYHVKILDIMLFIYGAFIELISCKLVLSTIIGHSYMDLGSAPWCFHMHLPYSYSLESEVRSHWHNGMNQDFVLKILKFWKYYSQLWTGISPCLSSFWGGESWPAGKVNNWIDLDWI